MLALYSTHTVPTNCRQCWEPGGCRHYRTCSRISKHNLYFAVWVRIAAYISVAGRQNYLTENPVLTTKPIFYIWLRPILLVTIFPPVLDSMEDGCTRAHNIIRGDWTRLLSSCGPFSESFSTLSSNETSFYAYCNIHFFLLLNKSDNDSSFPCLTERHLAPETFFNGRI